MKQLSKVIFGIVLTGLILSLIFAASSSKVDVKFISPTTVYTILEEQNLVIIVYTTPDPAQVDLVITKYPAPCYLEFLNSEHLPIQGGFNSIARYSCFCPYNFYGQTTMQAALHQKNSTTVLAVTDISIIKRIIAFKTKIQAWKVTKAVTPQLELFPDHDLWRDRKYKTCAVVGNGGSLFRSKLGKKIDSHELVIRFNLAPIKGFEEDVGKKLDVGFVNPSYRLSCWRWNDSLVFEHPKLLVVQFDPAYLNLSMSCQQKYPGTELQHLSQPFQDFLFRLVGELSTPEEKYNLTNPLPSGGIRGVFAATQVCEKVTLYGFWNGRERNRYDQGDKPRRHEFRSHSYATEKRIYEMLRNGIKDFLGHSNPFGILDNFTLEYGEDYELRLKS